MSDKALVFPSRANQVLFKQRILTAQRGFNFLKRKRDALDLKLNDIVKEMNKKKGDFSNIMRDSIIQVAKAKFIGLDVLPLMAQDCYKTNLTLIIGYFNVVGIQLPTLNLNINNDESKAFPLTGLGRGGQQVTIIRNRFLAATQYLVEIASLQFSVKILSLALQQTKLRVNGLEFVVIPKLQVTLEYIRDELDEYSREEFYRLKRSQKKHKKDL